jgi:hypothetical protein
MPTERSAWEVPTWVMTTEGPVQQMPVQEQSSINLI